MGKVKIFTDKFENHIKSTTFKNITNTKDKNASL